MRRRMRVAVPSERPGGLEAAISSHFGHCEVFTVVDVEEGKVVAVDTIANLDHEQLGCLALVDYLAGHGVSALVAGGMGLRPLMGFQQAGIQVYYGADAPNVGAIVEDWWAGRLPQFSPQNTCKGGCNSH